MFDNVNSLRSLWEVMKFKTRFRPSLVLALCLAMISGIIFPSSSYSSSSLVPSSPFPYIPGLGPTSADATTVSPSAAANNSGTQGQITGLENLRTYESPAFGISLQYPDVWGAVELQSNPADNRFPGSAIALFTSPRENASDNYREKILLGVQELSPSGNVTLEQFTNDSVNAYNNLSDSITILESNSTTLAGQPAHRIVFTEEVLGQNLKKAQVWTISDNKAYVNTFSAQESKFDEFLPAFESIIGSLQINELTSISNMTASTPPATPTSMGDLQQNLTYLDESLGFEMQYPSNWTRIQPGAPLDDREFEIVLSFISSTAPNTTSNTGNNSNASVSRVSIGIHDLSPSNGGETGNITLDDYTNLQTDFISQLDVDVIESEETTIGNLPAYGISFTVGNDDEERQTMQVWTVKGDKAYQFIYTASADVFYRDLPLAQNMLRSLQIR